MRLSGVAKLVSLVTVTACTRRPDPVEAYLERELMFFHAGVVIDDERAEVVHALDKGHMHVVGEVRGPGFCALGAASPRFAHTAVRVITQRGVVAGVDADRADVLHPGRVHLLEDVPVRVGDLTLVGWVSIAEGNTAGCAQLSHIDRRGYIHALQADLEAAGDVACLGSLEQHGGQLWGTLVWPGLSLGETPSLAVPVTFENRKLDDGRPPSRLVLRDLSGWTAPARKIRVEQLQDGVSFAQRHAAALELAALHLFEGQSTDAQREAYLQHAGQPGTAVEQQVWQEAVALIQRGWLSTEAAAASSRANESEPDVAPSDVLQDADHGQEAQKEEARDPR